MPPASGSAASRVRSVAQEWVDQPLKAVVLRSRIQRRWRERRFHSFGEASIVHKPMWIYGPHQIAIGSSTLILHGVWLSVEQVAWDRPAPVLQIGSFVSVRPHCTIAAAESVVIEDGVVLSSFTTVLDSDHTFTEGQISVMHSPVVTAPTRVGAGTWVGERVAILRGSDIGRGCVIGANSVVKGTIPDGSIAVGVPARVVGQVTRLPAR